MWGEMLRRSADAPPYISPSCPSGGSFYACGNTTTSFVGCCTRDGCLPGGCAPADVFPASFNPTTAGSFPNQGCTPGSGSRFYSCANTSPPFMGCCKSDPCAGGKGCAAADLVAVVLNTGDSGQQFLASVSQLGGAEGTGEVPLVGGTSAATLLPTAITLSAVPLGTSQPSTKIPGSTGMPMATLSQSIANGGTAATSSPTALAATNGTSSGSSPGTSSSKKALIAGTTLASVVLVAGLAVIAFFVFRRKQIMRRKSRQRFSTATMRRPDLFLPTTAGSDAVTMVSGPLASPDGFTTPPGSRGRDFVSTGSPLRFQSPTRANVPPPGVFNVTEAKAIPPDGGANANFSSRPLSMSDLGQPPPFDIGLPPPVQPKSERRPKMVARALPETARFYTGPSSPATVPATSAQSATPAPQAPPRPLPPSQIAFLPPNPKPVPPQQPLPQGQPPLPPAPLTGSSTYTSNRSSRLNMGGNQLTVPFNMPPARISANSISNQYPFSPQFLQNNSMFGNSPSASGPNFGFPILLPGMSPSPSPEPRPIPINRASNPQINVAPVPAVSPELSNSLNQRWSGNFDRPIQFPGGRLSGVMAADVGMLGTSPPLASSPPLVFAQPPRYQPPPMPVNAGPQQQSGTVREGSGNGDNFTIRAVPLDTVPEEGGASGSAASTSNLQRTTSIRNSRNSAVLGALQQRRMSPLSNVAYPPLSPERREDGPGMNRPMSSAGLGTGPGSLRVGGNGNGNGNGYGLGIGGTMPPGGPVGPLSIRQVVSGSRTPSVPLINFAGNSNGTGTNYAGNRSSNGSNYNNNRMSSGETYIEDYRGMGRRDWG